jgi:DNA repair exonuclease SbcCD ATPase subunit
MGVGGMEAAIEDEREKLITSLAAERDQLRERAEKLREQVSAYAKRLEIEHTEQGSSDIIDVLELQKANLGATIERQRDRIAELESDLSRLHSALSAAEGGAEQGCECGRKHPRGECDQGPCNVAPCDCCRAGHPAKADTAGDGGEG